MSSGTDGLEDSRTESLVSSHDTKGDVRRASITLRVIQHSTTTGELQQLWQLWQQGYAYTLVREDLLHGPANEIVL